MKKRILYIIFWGFIHSWGIAQKEDNNWLTGYDNNLPMGGISMSFNNNTLILDYFPLKLLMFSKSVISDSSGNLLCYTNGEYMMNRMHDTMPNGFDLCPEPDCPGYEDNRGKQGTILLPFPEHTGKYIMIHDAFYFFPNATPYSTAMYYSEIDMSLDNGLGDISQKNVRLTSDSTTFGKITACRHANGRDWWILKPGLRADKYYRFLLSPEGVQPMGIQTFPAFQNHPITSAFSTCVFSPDGTKYVHQASSVAKRFYVFGFDRCTGLLSDYKVVSTATLVPESNGPEGGVGISPNSRFLYVSLNFRVYQYDLQAADIDASKIKVAETDTVHNGCNAGGTRFMDMQLAPDNKIYVGPAGGSTYIHVVHSPDSQGVACNFEPRGLPLGVCNITGPPSFPNFRLGALSGSACDTLVSVLPPFGSAQGAGVKVYPNPAGAVVNVETGSCKACLAATGGTFRMWNPTGQVVLETELSPHNAKTEISVKDIPEGMYFYSITNHFNQRYYGKVWVQR
ncbi:MAG: T9SS type A sorting domain-containing protein [Bacteroidia bacterium]|nr:T9SS type A sorting domain-containing protein [Bacteroidia bacterium]